MENQLGDLLKDLRGDNSLRDIAKRTNISPAYLALLEKGIHPQNDKKIKPSPEVLQKLATAYNYPYEILMEAAGYMSKDEDVKNDDFVRRIAGIVRKPGTALSPADEENILKTIDMMMKMLEEGKKK